MTAYFRLPQVGKLEKQPAQSEAPYRERLQQGFAQVAAIVRATFSRNVCVTALLLGLVIASAMTVIYVNHMDRSLFIDLQKLQKQRDQYQAEWSQLLLEQSTWSALSRVEQAATEHLDMKVPDPEDVVMVK